MSPTEHGKAELSGSASRVLGWTKLAIALILVSIPLRVVALGWLPHDDVRRHAAKAFTERSWSEIVHLRAGAEFDQHAGWHATLALAKRAGLDSPRAVAAFAIVAAACAFLLLPAGSFRQPAAWTSALLAIVVFEPAFLYRLLSGRPLVLSATLLALVCARWTTFDGESFGPRRAAPWVLGFASVGFCHDAWYLWALPVAAIAFSGALRAARRLATCWLAGSTLAAVLTGHPFEYFAQPLRNVAWAFLAGDDPALLVSEFQPGQGGAALALLAAVALLARGGRAPRRPLADPVFVLAALGWGLGLAVSRFWSDWGIPALAVWLATTVDLRLEDGATKGPVDSPSLARVGAALAAACALFLAVTVNPGGRWSDRESGRHLVADDPALAGWLPDAGGSLYSNSMALFYDTFFENPSAPFRYVVSFEPGFLPPEDLRVFRDLQRTGAADRSFLPWIARLRPEDRVAVARPGGPAPAIAGLEWKQVLAGLWLGRRGDALRDGNATSPGQPLSPSP